MGSNDFEFSWTSLDKLVNEVIKQNAALFIRRQLTPQLAGLGVTVLTDPKWLRFCLNQLLTNAIKYSSPGQQISFTFSRNTLTVTDQGCGITASDLPRVFENGFTGHNGHQTTKATGMGLYLVKKVADRLGYQIKLQSTVGQGTSVSLSFPPENIR
jgi:signal transduction histidine kinase